MASQVKAVNANAHLFKVDRPLRQAFYVSGSWQPTQSPVVLCSAAYSLPFKGLHVAVRAIEVLRRRIPDVRLRIAGAHQRSGVRQDGYVRWINAVVRKLRLDDSVEWLGPLAAEPMAAELRSASAVVVPTFIESYCVALVEAMQIGTPTVTSYTGGTAYLGKDEDSCLFFPPGDELMCAFQLERLLTDGDLARKLSDRARSHHRPQ